MGGKIYADAAAALDGVLRDDMLIASGGFGLCGIPERLLTAIRDSGVKGLTFASMRAGGAGIPGFYTKTGVGTQVAEGKEAKSFDGEDYILERGIFADLAIVKAWKADETGNLVFRKTARNFNQPAATCGKVCVVEVEEIVPTGSLDPDCIHLPGVYVQRMIVGAPYDKKIEFETTRERESA